MKKNEPLYMSIMEIIKERIINGAYYIGEFIPTETELEDEFKVSRVTVRKAIEMLEDEGYLMKKSGRGTIVVSNSIFNRLSKGEMFSTILKKEGLQLRKEKTTISKLDIMPQNELYGYFGRNCNKIRRIYYLDGKPYIHFVHYIPEDVTFENLQNKNDFSLYMQLYKSNYFLNKFRDEFFIEYPSIEILNELNLKEGPLLGRKRVTYDVNSKVIEVSFAEYNTKIHNYVIKYEI